MSKDIRKLRPDKTIKITLDCWNVKELITNLLMEITELSPTCKVRRIVHNCQDLLNVAVSVIYPSNLLTELSSHIGKIKAIYNI